MSVLRLLVVRVVSGAALTVGLLGALDARHSERGHLLLDATAGEAVPLVLRVVLGLLVGFGMLGLIVTGWQIRRVLR